MTEQRKTKKLLIIKIVLLVLIVLISFCAGFYLATWRKNNQGIISYNDRTYRITNATFSKEEIEAIKNDNPYTNKKSRGYKIYIKEGSTPTGIYGEKNDELYYFSLMGGP